MTSPTTLTGSAATCRAPSKCSPSAFISEAPFEEDAQRNTDLMVLTLRTVRIACRIRRHDDIRYEGEFTIRCHRPSGQPTEIHKVTSGWGDYIFYAFADPCDLNGLCAWLLGDLSVFRGWLASELASGRKPYRVKPNKDGTRFHVYNISDLPKEFVVARLRPVTREAA